mmetsp:Transcript_30493/g.59845  ORF Transcript_30493/g.59845 Transcript_30493/m.59845 type:complete len:86 (+) Transcript_30493:652-909(+)
MVSRQRRDTGGNEIFEIFESRFVCRADQHHDWRPCKPLLANFVILLDSWMLRSCARQITSMPMQCSSTNMNNKDFDGKKLNSTTL